MCPASPWAKTIAHRTLWPRRLIFSLRRSLVWPDFRISATSFFSTSTSITSRDDLGFQYEPTLPSAIGPPFIQVGGYASVGDPITGPRNTFQNTFDFSGSLSWIHGRHELKFGGGYRHDQINALQGIATNGFFVFAASLFRSTTASRTFYSGNPVVFLQGGGNFAREIRDRASDAYGSGHVQSHVAADAESGRAI